uniref:Uncharacterized protein n=1 Tax=Panagrolaimus superbus TaxID=310955 RepID=A0A914Z9M3_9BILA
MESNETHQKTETNLVPTFSEDEINGYFTLRAGPSESYSTDSFHSGPQDNIDFKELAHEFKLDKLEEYTSKREKKKKKPSTHSKSANCCHPSKTNGQSSSSDALLLDFQGYPVISKLNPMLFTQNTQSLTSLSSISSELPMDPTQQSKDVRSSAASSCTSSICSEPPPERSFKTGYNFTVIHDSDIDSEASVTSQLPNIHKVYPSPSPPRLSSTTIGSFSDNMFSFGDAKDIYRTIEPQYTIKGYKNDSDTSMESTQTASDLFPLGEGYSPGGTSQNSFEPPSFGSSSSLSSISSTCVFPKAKIELSSDEKVTFSSASNKSSDNSIVSDFSSSDSSCCVTAESDFDFDDDNGNESDIICSTTEVFENALNASPQKMIIENDKCAAFYLENRSSDELLIALDAPHGIDCSPTDMTIEGHKKKKILVVARKSMLPGTRNSIYVTYKLSNLSSRFKVPFTIV